MEKVGVVVGEYVYFVSRDSKREGWNWYLRLALVNGFFPPWHSRGKVLPIILRTTAGRWSSGEICILQYTIHPFLPMQLTTQHH